jgi:alanine racemase
MGLRLTVDRRAWQRAVETTAAAIPGLVPVVKGNGYGFGRSALMATAAQLGAQIAVGSVYEARDVPSDRVAVVLTPHVATLPADLPRTAVLAVGAVEHVDALAAQGWRGAITVKLRSSMLRHGVAPANLAGLLDAVTAVADRIAAFTLHLPLAGTDDERIGEVIAWLPELDPAVPLSLSHLSPVSLRELRERFPDRSLTMRVGTALWHGDKSFLHVSADVLGVTAVRAGERAGYHATPVPGDGHVVLVACGSAHGVRPLAGDVSPFHFARRRLALVERPHMHTSMVFVRAGDPCPATGDRVDVQHPLIDTHVDELVWTDG